MLCVAGKISFRQLSAEIPAELVDRFGEAAERLGISKKRLLATAADYFLAASDTDQFRLALETYSRWYTATDDATPEPTPAPAETEEPESEMMRGLRENVGRTAAAKKSRGRKGHQSA